MSDNSILQKNLDYTLFSWSPQRGVDRMVIDRAKGVYLYDTSGKRYIDFSSQLICVNIGHGHPKVLDAVSEQMKKFAYVYPGRSD